MDIEKLKKAYDEIYGKFEKELQKHYYYDYAIVDEMSSGVAGTLKHKIDETYLPFIEYVVKTNRQYYGGYSARELLTFIQTNDMFCLSNGIEAPLSLISIYYVDGNLSSAEYYFARDKYETNNDCECTVGYKIGIGFDGTKWFTLKCNLDPYKTTKSIWKEKTFANFHSDTLPRSSPLLRLSAARPRHNDEADSGMARTQRYEYDRQHLQPPRCRNQGRNRRRDE